MARVQMSGGLTITAPEGKAVSDFGDSAAFVEVEASKAGTTWLVDRPCPQCGQTTVGGMLLVDERGRHQHTRYVCTFWRSGLLGEDEGFRPAHEPCGWEGWSVP